tara:strand:+ start:5750 stop:6421 length:672 start_codon:yes stop_codon:yes gene_type:complete
MSICILFILANGFGYVTPACYDGYELVTPHSVAFVQHLPSEYDLYESPEYYVNYYWAAREEYCRNYNYSWDQGWNIWAPNVKYRELCRDPNYLAAARYYNIPYRVRYNVRNRLRTYKRHHHYSYKKYPRYKKYKKYGKYKHHYKKHHGAHKKQHKKQHKKHHYKKRQNRSSNYKSPAGSSIPQLRKKTTRRHYNKNGDLRRRTTTRRYSTKGKSKRKSRPRRR